MGAPEGLLRGDSHEKENDAMLGILCESKKESEHRPAMMRGKQ